MSSKERRRVVVMNAIEAGELSVVEAAGAMRVSYRQAKRIWHRYRHAGDAGLVHRARGGPGRHGKPASERKQALGRYRERYTDFGPTLAAEYLAKEGLVVDHETLRRWLLEEGLWEVSRGTPHHHHWGRIHIVDISQCKSRRTGGVAGRR